MKTANLDRASRDGELRILLREPGTTTVLGLSGEWDIAGLPAARRVMSDALGGHPEFLVLDLSHLTFIDSSGLHATIELAYRAGAQHTRLVIIPGPYPVQRAFELCGLVDRLPFIDPRPPGSAAAPSIGQEPSRLLALDGIRVASVVSSPVAALDEHADR